MPTHRVRATAAALLAAGLMLTGCSDDGSSSKSENSTSPTVTQSSDQSTDQSSDQPSASSSQSGQSSSIDALVAAGALALEQVENATVISIETERDGAEWEVQVVTPDGVEHEVRTSGDGTKLVGQPTTDDDDADDRAKHKARVKAAKIDFQQAAQAMTAAVDGNLTELNLDDHNGTTVWEGDVVDDSGTKHEIKIDAGSGKVISKSTD